MTSTILLVDDEVKIRLALGAALRDEGYDVAEAANGLEARRRLGLQPFDVLVIDNLMPDMTGLDVIREVSASVPEGDRPQILMMTAYATMDSAIEAMKLGAFDYLQKPFEVDELLVVVRRVLEHQRLRTQHRYLLSEQREAFDQYGIVGRSARMQEVIRLAELVAGSRSTVLITGETGTGKELVARAIHDRSGQREMPLIKVNCAAIPDNLLESELFGHRRGAFTGAATNKKGRFELANGGTILLDEIGTMSLGLQAKLLRVLQEREFEPLGAERTLRVDVRVIAATNRDLKRLMSDGAFAEDLYYRLNVVPIEIPPLRERREDIPVLVDHFMRKHAQRAGKRVEKIDQDARLRLQTYDWPGNVRELENTIERAVVLSTDTTLTARAVSLPGADRGLSSLDRLPSGESAPERRVGRTRDNSAGPGGVGRREVGGRGADRHQPARAESLSLEAQDRLTFGPVSLLAHSDRRLSG